MPKFSRQKSAYSKQQLEPESHEKTYVPRVNPRNIRMRALNPKNPRQEALINSIADNDLTFVRGQAGTGKTFVVAGAALQALIDGEVEVIIISRPAVKAGEDLGFTPGDILEKMGPFIDPMVSAFKSFVGPNLYQALLEGDFIKVLPFAYMRGHSISNAFIFLDECQNATADQMKTALTRLGEGSVCVVAFDPDQIDLDDKNKSCVNDLVRFENTRGIGFVSFLPEDCLRSRIVRTVLDCYTKVLNYLKAE